jgi:hypothetical protein
MKTELEPVQNWSRWCPCHNGAPPYFDLTGYKCNSCGKTVCAGCIYKTEKGYLCVNCVKKLKPSNIEKIIVNSENQKRHSLYLKAIIIVLVIYLIAIFASTVTNPPIEILFCIGFSFFIIVAIIILTAIYKLLKEKSQKKSINIPESEIQKLDDLAKEK